MKKILLMGILLIASVAHSAVDMTVTFTDAQYARLTKTAGWKGVTRQSIVRDATIDRLNYEKEFRKRKILFTNESSICAAHDC